MTSEQAILKKNNTNQNAHKIVGVISDTHIPSRARSLPKQVLEIFEKADYIIHAGDIVELAVLDELEQLAPVVAVHGNMDGPNVSGALPKMSSLKVFGWKIGVMHDPSTAYGMNRMREIAKQNGFDVFVYVHTHVASIKWEGKMLYVNPGSATDPPFLVKPSVALLRVSEVSLEPEIIHFNF
jgi:putative phosphoesterase